jgi:hypothetical protein
LDDVDQALAGEHPHGLAGDLPGDAVFLHQPDSLGIARSGTRSPGGEAGGGPVGAEHVRVGDVVLLGDGTLAVIDSVCFGSYWLDSGRQEPAVALGWCGGTSRGVMFERIYASRTSRRSSTVLRTSFKNRPRRSR